MKWGLLAAVMVLLVGCGSDILDDKSDLIVVNESPCDVTVFVDGQEVLSVEAGSDRAFSDIGYGRHVIEAVNYRGEVVVRRVVDLAPAEDFYLVVNNC
ncbi:MAG: hypothetical protein KatS3mg007_0088 [Thermoanaerobaculum sp.]|nr:MAG: hypothetical protein KatS3mg007_0088 [Thermoanaerobaculum sp.]